ncbi:hypothetical protein GCM10009715_38540 [Paeniglutamicibacter psychrophenolicus]|uniref:Integral membrane protein (TIGR01906 family) n=1 Tax=Paeniglutamicibacter psychrophenolicus TaxID=257454 RepID=A0ABS4WIA9_9MICC|nr:TIGR01906 family membrane protein [Paeniglutamicibacter psychrophenolicus]MBP2375949.1 integral membrane protein (TIGR01906 family) [Paeniglutamicibacter psychrophenolicus]
MAEQDKVQTGKPDAPASPPAAPAANAEAKPASGSLSAAAAAAAAKIEASLAASRAAAAAAAQKPATAPAPAKAPAAEPAQAAKPAPAQAPEAKAPADNAPAPTKAPSAKPPAAAPLKPAAKPVAKPKREEPEEIEDIIAKIPVEPLPETTKVSVSAAPATAAPAPVGDDRTQTLPRPSAAAQGAGTPPETASAIAEARNRVFGAYTPVPEPTPAARERRAAREAALDSKPPLARTLQVLLAIAYPFILLILAIRLIASPIFLWIAYQRPGFPADGFGFTTADRLTYGSYGVDFLNNVADNRYLGDLRFPNGNPLFLGTEVQHMADVKNVMSFTYLGGIALGVIAVIALAYLGKRYAGGIRRGLFAGSVVTLVLLAGLTTVAILGWDSFFTTFHEIFFSQGNWTFNYSDTLIRLYPPQFWVDAAIGIAGMVVLTALITLIRSWPTAKRREAARLRQEKRVFGL